MLKITSIIPFWNQLIKTVPLTPILQEKKFEKNILSQGGPFRPKNPKMPLWGAQNAFLGPKKITTAFLTS